MNAAIYVRVSTAGQEAEGTSLDTQEAACRAYAAQHGYTVAEVYREVHTGAELWERPQLTTLRDSVRAGRVRVVIAHALDRLSRKQAHVAIVADECERAGVSLQFVTEEFEQSPVGEFIRSAKAFAAELEREKIKERMQRGMQARIAAGKIPSKTKPNYGYRWRDDDKAALVIDETTAPIMRRIFAEAASGVALRKIAAGLNADGIPTPSGRGAWHFATIRKMLLREEYVGVAVALKEKNTKVAGRRVRVPRAEDERIVLPEGTVPPLVDRAIFDAVRAQLVANQAQAIRNHRHPERFLLRAGFVCCGYCGKSIGAYCGNVITQKGRQYRVADRYRANAHNTDCPLVWHNARELDRDVWAHVYAILTRREIIEREVARRRRSDPTAAGRRSTERLLAEVERKQTNLVRTLADIDDRDSRDLFKVELADLAKQKRALAAELATLEAQREAWREEERHLDNLQAWCRKVAQGLDNADYETKRDALTALGVRVRVYAVGHHPRWDFDTTHRLDDPEIQSIALPRYDSAPR